MNIGIVATNAQQFNLDLDAALLKLEEKCNRVFRGYCVAAFTHVVQNTPQWSGAAAASWNISVLMPDFTPDRQMADEYRAATPVAERVYGLTRRPGWAREVFKPRFNVHGKEAVARAFTRNAGRGSAINIHTTVFLANSSEGLSKKAYVAMVEANPNNYLRPENEGGHMVWKTVMTMQRKYSPISPADSFKLQGLKI